MRIFSKLLPASRQKLVISSIGIVVLVAFASFMLFQVTQKEVVLVENGKDSTIDTHANTVEELLEEVGITVAEHDQLSHDIDVTIVDGMKIEYDTAHKVTVVVDGNEKVYYSVADTVNGFLEENKLSITERDEISHNLDEAINGDLTITIKQAFEVAIQDGGKEVKAWSTGGSVQDLLAVNNITLSELDKIEPAIDEAVTKDTTISIVRVEKKTEEVTESIAFQTETRTDSSMEKGEETVLASGTDGSVVKTYEVTYENGKEVTRELLEEEVTKESENRIVVVGTKEPAQDLVTLSSGKELTMTASAFTANCSGCSGYTATGINLKANPNQKVIAVDPSVIPLGTKVWVEGYGEAIAGDTGGHIQGFRIDVHVPTKADAYQWGVRKVKVKIIE
ncbi:ubiquitin-like domain-containing protein [Ornithinibacillus xuwenensis]|jgi:resuscitation-promoting factor RpfB|uniref:Ubiquitin-like domain-containing protein n=1 Tax=Ornithinibacillus xuwenensis TaxID=3144668 RepID=A0ABU9XEN1_9BACI